MTTVKGAASAAPEPRPKSKAQRRREAREQRRRARVRKQIAELEAPLRAEQSQPNVFAICSPHDAQQLVALYCDRDRWDAPKAGEQLILV